MSDHLDLAYERLATAGFELPNGFVNHGPMACEALDILGCTDEVEPCAVRFARWGPVEAVYVTQFDWEAALGVTDRLPEWIGFFERAIEADGWPAVLEAWVPRLGPSFATALFHGVIRVAHATRAMALSDTAPRRVELARALAYWAARYRPGPAPLEPGEVTVLDAATAAARRYVIGPDIFTLHGVTSAMALALLSSHVPSTVTQTVLGQLLADHDGFYGDAPAVAAATVDADWPSIVESAASSRDPHQVKLVEACGRGWGDTGDGVFGAAAELVVGR